MSYTLVLPNGRRMQFYLESVALLYQQIHGGLLLKNNKAYLKLVDKLAA